MKTKLLNEALSEKGIDAGNKECQPLIDDLRDIIGVLYRHVSCDWNTTHGYTKKEIEDWFSDEF